MARRTDLEGEEVLGKSPDNERRRAEQSAEVGGIAAGRLRSLVERIERLEQEPKALGNNIKDILTGPNPPAST